MLAPLLLLLGSAPSFDTAYLEKRIMQLEAELPQAKLGVAIKDLKSGETWTYRGHERFPMQSVFKFPLGVVALRASERRKLNLKREITLRKSDLSVPFSLVNQWFEEGRKEYTVERLLQLTVQSSDNTGADVIMKMLGGPSIVNKELELLGVRGVRIDRYEHDLQRHAIGLGPFKPEWSTERGFMAAVAKIPKANQIAALKSYLVGPQDTATPVGMMNFIDKFQGKKLLKPDSQTLLMKWMTATTTGANRLIKGLPKGSKLAHKTGTGREIFGRSPAVNDVGIATLPGGRRLIIVAFLAGAGGTEARRDRALAEVARAAVTALR